MRDREIVAILLTVLFMAVNIVLYQLVGLIGLAVGFTLQFLVTDKVLKAMLERW